MRINEMIRRAARPLALALAIAAGPAAGPALAQQGARTFFTEPSLILAGPGHHAPVRTLAFGSADGSQLLSGGMDKAIRIWDLDGDRSRPARTLRPPLWRGYLGQVYAMALTRPGGPADRRLLAVAGYGISSTYGEILLFRGPEPAGQGTGEVVAQLPATAADGTLGPGHSAAVTSLAFSPDDRLLASASVDATVRIWDVAARRQVAVLADARGPLNHVAYFARGTRLVSGGRDGVLRVYDVATPAARPPIAASLPVLRDPADAQTAMIQALAVTPDDRFLIVGTEGGDLIRYDAATLANPAFLKDRLGPTSAVEAVAISPDGRRLATSTVARISLPAERPDPTCRVELRSLPDGGLQEVVAEPSNLVYALAFSPDGRRLAYSGGDAQAVFVRELTPNPPPVDELRGPGSSLWDVGFRADGRAIRFARARGPAPGQAPAYEGFDLRARRPFRPESEPAAVYRHASAAEGGWAARPATIYRVDFVNARGAGWPGELDPILERRWWSYAIIPPDPAAGHADPVGAVGSETGVALWNLRTGRMTRFFAGHAGPVYALASSPDGRWLVTGSSDQTARLWSLVDCDKPAPFGATFDRNPAGAWVVRDVAPGGFADGIGLKPGHVVEKFFVGRDEKDPAEYLNRLEDARPSTYYGFHARLAPGGELLVAGTSRRDSPALTLFPGEDREWVLWTPRGHYDTSVAGDRRYLGWLTNRGTVARLLAGSFDTIDKFERRFRQPRAPAANVIDRLLDTADARLALLALPPVDPAAPGPTTSRLDQIAILPAAPVAAPGPVAAPLPTLAVSYRAVAAEGAALIRRAYVAVNGREVAPIALAAPAATVEGVLAVPVGLGRDQVVSLVVEDATGTRRARSIEVANTAPAAPARRKGRLEILAIGAETFADRRLDPIPYAGRDAEDLAGFFRDRAVDPTSAAAARFEPDRVRARTLASPPAAAIVAALDDLRLLARNGGLAADDVVVLAIESHFVQVASRRLLAAAGPDAAGPAPASIDADDLADRLGELAALGCRVFVLVDGVHPIKQEGWDHEIKEWVRQLQARSQVAAFLASEHDPSLTGEGHRAFAQGVLGALDLRSRARAARKAEGPMTLFDFQRTVIDSVLEQTGRKQRPQFYLPDSISIRTPFLDRARPGR